MSKDIVFRKRGESGSRDRVEYSGCRHGITTRQHRSQPLIYVDASAMLLDGHNARQENNRDGYVIWMCRVV